MAPNSANFFANTDGGAGRGDDAANLLWHLIDGFCGLLLSEVANGPWRERFGGGGRAFNETEAFFRGSAYDVLRSIDNILAFCNVVNEAAREIYSTLCSRRFHNFKAMASGWGEGVVCERSLRAFIASIFFSSLAFDSSSCSRSTRRPVSLSACTYAS